MAMITQAEDYFTKGCGRCAKFATPECKTRHWHDGLVVLRKLALGAGLKEEVKWGHPCYTDKGRNIVLIHSFKDYCAMMFFKGALMKDPNGLLIQQTENVQSGRQLRFDQPGLVGQLAPVITAYIHEAIALEQSGARIELKTFRFLKNYRRVSQPTPP
jgi:uncharacterized protein YdeI (YjbR/CyaY-like superfamily)